MDLTGEPDGSRVGGEMLRYRLAVLTHGDDGTAREAVDSFLDNVTPAPTDGILMCDGGTDLDRRQHAVAELDFPWKVMGWEKPQGFCTATRMLWREAAREKNDDVTHVFWLEHDFRFVRQVQLDVLARLMAATTAFAHQKVAQMSLMRNAVNDDEMAAGGLYASRHRDYTSEGQWMSQRSYFTTNPGLMTLPFMRANPWPEYTSACEGRFTHDLLSDGYVFGVYGDGSEYVEHVGVRSGFGY